MAKVHFCFAEEKKIGGWPCPQIRRSYPRTSHGWRRGLMTEVMGEVVDEVMATSMDGDTFT